MTVTTDSSELIMPCIVSHLTSKSAIQNKLGRAPCVRIFPGDVPEKVDGQEILPPWVNVERGDWQEEMSFSGGTGQFNCPTTIAVVASTMKAASEIYATLRPVLNGRWSEIWNARLWVTSSELSMGQQQPLLEPDGSPSRWQQIVGELSLLCCVLPVTD